MGFWTIALRGEPLSHLHLKKRKKGRRRSPARRLRQKAPVVSKVRKSKPWKEEFKETAHKFKLAYTKGVNQEKSRKLWRDYVKKHPEYRGV